MTDSTALALGPFLVLALALYLWTALALSAVFRKSGQESWKAWVPVLNEAVILRMGGFSGWFLLLTLIPVFGWIVLYAVHVMACHRINIAFGLGGGMTVLAALLFPVWASVLGFGSVRWLGHPEDIGGPSRTPADAGTVYPDWAARPTAPVLPTDTTAATAAATSPAEGRAVSPAESPVQVSVPPFVPPLVPSPAPGADPFPAALPERAWMPAERGGAEPAAEAPAPAGTTAEQAAHAAAVAPRGDRTYGSELDDDLDVSAIAPGVTPPQSAASASRVRRAGWEEPDEDVAYPPAGPDLSGRADGDLVARRDAADGLDAADDSDLDEDSAVGHVPAAAPPAAPARAASTPQVTRLPAAQRAPVTEPWAPRRSPQPESTPDISEEVSAVAGAPIAGAPRSALGAVSALYARPGLPDDESLDETIITRRRRVDWELVPPIGKAVDITSEVIIVGRRPAPDPEHPSAQLIPIADETRTVSKTHARLELRADHWVITDLGSTNGVLLATLMGTEMEAQPGVEVAAGERFFLGDAEVRLRRSGT